MWPMCSLFIYLLLAATLCLSLSIVSLSISGNSDNKSAINIANNPVQHDRTKHVEIDRFFIKEKIDNGILQLSHVNPGGQIADCVTKGLGVKECNIACSKMGMIDIYHPS